MDERTGGDSAGEDILLVEDEAILMMVAAETLRDAGWSVRECGSAEEAAAALDGGARFAMLITDHSLPGMTGGDLARLAHDRHGIRRILIATGTSGGCDFGFPVLAKPYRDHELTERVAAAMAGDAAA